MNGDNRGGNTDIDVYNALVQFAEEHGYAGLRAPGTNCKCSIKDWFMRCLEYTEDKVPVDCIFWKETQTP